MVLGDGFGEEPVSVDAFEDTTSIHIDIDISFYDVDSLIEAPLGPDQAGPLEDAPVPEALPPGEPGDLTLPVGPDDVAAPVDQGLPGDVGVPVGPEDVAAPADEVVPSDVAAPVDSDFVPAPVDEVPPGDVPAPVDEILPGDVAMPVDPGDVVDPGNEVLPEDQVDDAMPEGDPTQIAPEDGVVAPEFSPEPVEDSPEVVETGEFDYAPQLTDYGTDQVEVLVGEPWNELENWHALESEFATGIATQQFLLESITGETFQESELADFAYQAGIFDPAAGTYPEDMGSLLSTLGIPTEMSYGNTMDGLADQLAQGNKVIVGVDGEELWHTGVDPVLDEVTEDVDWATPGADGFHAVQVTGIVDTPDGPMVAINDCGNPYGAGSLIPLAEFENAWADSDHQMVVADPSAVSAPSSDDLAAEPFPPGEVPVDELPADTVTPVDQPPADLEAPVVEAPVEEAPADFVAPVDEVPVDPAGPVDEASPLDDLPDDVVIVEPGEVVTVEPDDVVMPDEEVPGDLPAPEEVGPDGDPTQVGPEGEVPGADGGEELPPPPEEATGGSVGQGRRGA